MKRLLAAAVASALILVAGASSADARPTPSFTALAMGGQTVAFDASASVCAISYCGYNWKYYGPTTNRLGVQMGNLAKISFRFPAIGFYSVILTVSEKCSPKGVSSCPATLQQQVEAR
jgi:hypothetical protein